MQRTTAPNSSSGQYVDGDPNIPGTGTLVIAEDKNMIQEEIANAVEGAGLTLSSAQDQLSTAIKTQHIYRASETYAVNDYVFYSGNLYISKTASNTGNQPDTSPTNWKQIDVESLVWDTLVTYTTNDFTFYEGIPYRSLTASNTGNQPDISPSNWEVTGGGSGGGTTTLVDNSDFEANTDGWTVSNGTSTVTRTTAVGEVLIGDGSGVITTSANAGDTIDADLVGFDRAFQYNQIECKFTVEFDATYVDDTLEAYLLCDATEVYMGKLRNTDQVGRFVGYAVPVPGATTYKLRFKTATGVVSGSTVTIDRVEVYDTDVLNISQPMLTAQAIEMNYTVGPNVDNVKVTTGTTDRGITIPAGFPVGRKIKIQKVDSGTGLIFIVPSGAETFPASMTSLRLTSQYDFWELEKATDTTWALVGGFESDIGWKKLYDGMLEQWDLYAISAYPFTVTFPMVFPISVDTISGHIIRGGAGYIFTESISTRTTTGFQGWSLDSAGTPDTGPSSTLDYKATGRWY